MMTNVPVETRYVTERRQITTDVTESVDVLSKPVYTWDTKGLTHWNTAQHMFYWWRVFAQHWHDNVLTFLQL